MADVFWRGGAAAVQQVTTLTFAGIWAAADTYSFSIGGKSLLLTVGSAVTVSDVANEFVTAFNATDKTTGAGAGYVRSSGGQQIPEFQGIVAASPSAGVVTLTGKDTGEPFQFTDLATTAGTGDVTDAATIAPTGPNHLDNPANYLAGALPVTGSTIVFDQGNTDALYGLEYFRTNSIEHNLRIYGNWRGQLGLAPVNPAGYPEYRTRYYRWQTAPNHLEILPSTDGYTDQKALYIDIQGCPASIVRVLAGRGDGQKPMIFLSGGDATTGLATFEVERGNVYVESPDVAPTNAFFADGIVIGTPGGNVGDCTVYFGEDARLAESLTLYQYSGRVYSAAPTLNGAEEVTINLLGGEFHSQMYGVAGGGTPALQDVNVSPGATFFMTGEATVENVDLGGIWDQRQGNLAVVFMADFLLNKGCSVFDPGGRGVTKLKLAPTCSLHDCTIQTGPGLNWAA